MEIKALLTDAQRAMSFSERLCTAGTFQGTGPSWQMPLKFETRQHSVTESQAGYPAVIAHWHCMLVAAAVTMVDSNPCCSSQFAG